MMKYLLCLLLMPIFVFANQCKVVNQQCTDKSATKTINGVVVTLADVCSELGLTGEDCCWSSSSKYYCADDVDTCGQYRKNSNCSLIDNTCIDKDYISGTCNKFQSKYSCAGGYQDVESRVCTNVVCSNNESGTAAKCFNPKEASAANTAQMGSVIAYLQMGQNMAQDMNCSDMGDPSSCTLFSGKYFTCGMYMFDASQPGSFNNNGADCGLSNSFFTSAGVATGYKASDRNVYSQATSGTNSVMGSGTNYSLSNDNAKAVNTTVKLNQQDKMAVVNQDQNINYTPNSSSNSKMKVQNGQVVSVTINKDTAKDIGGFTSFKDYLSDVSVNLAWNRLKAEPDPQNPKSITFAALGVTRPTGGKPFGWSSGTWQPTINGLCVHLADSCEGGDDSATVSDAIKAQFSWAGGYTNPNFCASCTTDLFGACLTGEPRNTIQQWCCFNSKVSMDINIAAYDQGLMNFYTNRGSRYEDQINHGNGICGGVTVGMISKIDFSKANYFKDMMDAIDVNQIIDNTSFTSSVQGNTSNRSNSDATKMVDEWKSKNGS